MLGIAVALRVAASAAGAKSRLLLGRSCHRI